MPDKVVASIFVNPTQFAPHEDFDPIPARWTPTAPNLPRGRRSLIFAPFGLRNVSATALPPGSKSGDRPWDWRPISGPHFFDGVATIVAKLLIAAVPDCGNVRRKGLSAIAGVQRLVADLGLPMEIIGAPIVREADGLAMSSRNAYLTPAERQVAGQLNLGPEGFRSSLHGGASVAAAEADRQRALLEAGFDFGRLFALRDAETLAPLIADPPARCWRPHGRQHAPDRQHGDLK